MSIKPDYYYNDNGERKKKDNKKQKKNLQTIYRQAIFGNTENRPKLNGEAEIFYRPASSLDNMKEKSINEKKIIEHYRFSKEKFVFHCPITLNFCLKNNKVNDEINHTLAKESNNITFLGIDRGEKHLAYYSLVDQNWKIIKQGACLKPILNFYFCRFVALLHNHTPRLKPILNFYFCRSHMLYKSNSV